MSENLKDRPTFALLGATPEAEQAEFLAGLVQTSHEHGEVLFREGDPGDHLLLILEGRVRLSRLTAAADELKLASLGAGEVVGEMAVLSPAPRSAAATAEGPTRVARLSRDALLERLVLEDPVAGTLLRNCTRLVAERLRRTRGKVALVRDALRGAEPGSVDARLAALVGEEAGPLATRMKSWLASE